MSIVTVRVAIKTILTSITGVTKAYVQLPRGEIADADLPCGITFVRDATDPENPEDMYVERRNYIFQLLILPQSEGLDQGEAEGKVEPFITLVRDAFKGAPSLGGVLGVQSARLTGDSGPRQLVWAGVIYWGCEFKMAVEEYVPRIFADSE